MTDIETLEGIIEDYIGQNELSVYEVVFLLEALKFRILYVNELGSRDDTD